MVVTGGPHAGDFLRVLRNGRQFGVRHLEYMYQENPEGGLAQGLGLCEEFVNGESVAFILGDNTTDAEIRHAIERFEHGAMVFLKHVPDPERFGCPIFSADDPLRIERIEEKPALLAARTPSRGYISTTLTCSTISGAYPICPRAVGDYRREQRLPAGRHTGVGRTGWLLERRRDVREPVRREQILGGKIRTED
jgi:hypothetical protein